MTPTNMNDSIFIKACRGEVVERIPVWFMRQAGRSLPGYRKLRETHNVLSLTNTPELAAQVSIEPVELLGVDAAILFADIMLLPIAMGVDVKIIDGVGPVIDTPIDTPDDIARLLPYEVTKSGALHETIKILRAKLSVPVIGFSGAPFTLASYLIEGKPNRTWLKTKRFMLEHPEGWDQLMTLLSDGVIDYLKGQVTAGANAVQLFDSWVGCLSPEQYERFVLPYMQRIFTAIKDTNVPRLHFATNTAGILQHFANVDCEVIGVDWRMTLAFAKANVGAKALQGNLDPTALLVPWDELTASVDTMLAQINPKQGYIFNLGHGMMPEANDVQVKRLVDYVHAK